MGFWLCVAVALLSLFSAVANSLEYPEAWGMSESYPRVESDLQQETLDLGKTPMDHLRETPICEFGKTCSFKSKIFNHMRSTSFSGAVSTPGKGVAMPASVQFDVTSECGTKTHHFYRMDVDKFKIGRSSVAAFLEYPLYFDVDKKTGKIDNVYYSGKDIKSVRCTKHTLLLQLAKLVHPSAIAEARNGAAQVSYIFEGNNDLNGKYVAKHTLMNIGNGNIGLTESIMFGRARLNVAGRQVPIDDQRFAMRQKKTSKTRLSQKGNFLELLEKDVVQIGHHSEFSKERPLFTGETPNFGRQTAKVNTNIVKTKIFPNSGKCPSEEAVAMKLPMQITENLQQVFKRKFRAPLTTEDWGDEDVSPRQAFRKMKRARMLLREHVIDFSKLSDCVNVRTAAKISKLALKSFHAHALSEANLRKVVGSLSGVRNEVGYRQLLLFMHDRNLPVAVREEAVVAMIHSKEEPSVPFAFIDSVSRIAHNPTDPISGSARLLLGNLLQGHAGKPKAMKHLKKLHKTLQAHLKNNVADVDISDDAQNLLLTFGNAGAAASPFVADIEMFMDERFDPAVRHSAADALNSIASHAATLRKYAISDLDKVDSDGAEKPYDGELGPVKKQPLLKCDELIYGNREVEIKAIADLGIKYGGHEEGAFGKGSLHGRVLDFKKDLATVEFNSAVKRKEDVSGATGSMEFVFKVAGSTVTKKNKPWDMDNVMHGGIAPATYFDAITVKPPDKQDFNRVLCSAAVRCGPATVKINIKGLVGYEIGWAGWLNAVTSDNMANEKGDPTKGKASSCSSLHGGLINGKIDVVVVSASCPGCKVGFEGDFMLFHGKMPAYCIIDNNMGNCKIDVKIERQRGKWRLYGKCFAPAMERTMIEWNYDPIFRNIEQRDYGPLVNGNLMGHPDTDSLDNIEISQLPSKMMTEAMHNAVHTPATTADHQLLNKPVLALA